MKVIKFRFTVLNNAGKKRRVSCVIYPTFKSMYQGTRQFEIHKGSRERGSDEVYDFAAITHCFEYRDPLDMSLTRPDMAIIRMTREQLNTEVFAHEATHAALHIAKVDDPVKAIESYEEEVPILVGRITRLMVNKLYEHNVLT